MGSPEKTGGTRMMDGWLDGWEKVGETYRGWRERERGEEERGVERREEKRATDGRKSNLRHLRSSRFLAVDE